MGDVKILAKIEHNQIENKNIVFIFDNDYINNDQLIYELYHIKNKCDICNKSIDRKTTFIILKDEKMLQVGKGCLKKLIPASSKQNQKDNIFINDHLCINRYMKINTFLNYFYQIIKKEGFKKNDTISYLIQNLNKMQYDNNINNEINNIIDTIIKADGLNNFQENIRIMIKRDFIDLKKDINIFQYVLNVYEQIKKKELKNNATAFIGNAGDKIVFTVKEILSIYNDSYYINSFYSIEQKTYTFLDNDNNVLRITTKKDIKDFINCSCTATIKRHFNLKNGSKCTQIKLITKIA